MTLPQAEAAPLEAGRGPSKRESASTQAKIGSTKHRAAEFLHMKMQIDGREKPLREDASRAVADEVHF